MGYSIRAPLYLFCYDRGLLHFIMCSVAKLQKINHFAADSTNYLHNRADFSLQSLFRIYFTLMTYYEQIIRNEPFISHIINSLIEPH